MIRRLVLVLACAGANLFTVSAWSQLASRRHVDLDARQQAALGIRTSPIQAADHLSVAGTATVTVPPGREYTVSAPYGGVVARIDAGLGDAVRTGLPLARYSSPALAELRRQDRESQLELQNSQAAWERDQAMFDDGLIPAARVQLSLNRYKAAQAAAQAQRDMLHSGGAGADPTEGDLTAGVIRAAAPGQIVEALARAGQRVEAGTVLFRIADLSHLELDLTIAADKASRVRTGDVVAIAQRDASAVILGVGRALDAAQQAHARARVVKPGRLQLGETLSVRIDSAWAPAPGQTVWRVPTGAVVRMAGQAQVFRVVARGYELIAAEIIASDDIDTLIRAPLAASDRVAAAGLAGLRSLLEAGE